MEEELRQQIQTWKEKGKLLDIRTAVKGSSYIKGSTYIPYNENFELRWCELPNKNEGLNMLISEEGTEMQLVEKIKQRGWKIEQVFKSNSLFWKLIEEFDLLATDYEYNRLLFSPAPFLLRNLKLIETILNERFGHKPHWSTLDIGCGSGRDMAWLAFNNKKFHLYGIDCVQTALNRVELLFSNLNLQTNLKQLIRLKFLPDSTFKLYTKNQTLIYNDIGKIPFINVNKFQLILCVRYLERASFIHLYSLLASGGILLFSTFLHLEGCSDYEPSLESGKRLLPGELVKEFGSQFQVLIDCIEYSEDNRPLNSFLAVKK
ncbi:hypothetical protein K502DRAFT_326277 [Neoconidiobolus thromboides FSU 785]|nr:hypothetical protein K502DRAFT_326277 [Neoconidiobolus thromboides FSU 785]